MFAREVNGSLARAFVATESGVLSHFPAGVAAEKMGIACGVAQGGPAGVVSADAGEDTLQLLEAVVGIALDVRRVGSGGIGCWWRISGPSWPARIINKQSACACLTGGSVPERLNRQVRDDETVVGAGPGAILVPVGLIELQEQLGDCAVAKLFDGCLLEGIKTSLLVIDATQCAEGQGEDRMFALHFQ